jgi:Spy/CpxP family protein refolding chaperone
MKARQNMLLGLLVAMMATGVLAAQDVYYHVGPPETMDPATMAQHHVQMLTRVLSLTSDQQQQALTIFTNSETSSAGIHDSMKTAHESLASAVKTNDAAAIGQAATTIGNLTTEMVTTHAKADGAFYALLTPDQQAKFDKFGQEFGQKVVFGMGRMADGPPPETLSH